LSTDWQSMFGELIPLALVVALSPFSIVPAVLLVLHAGRPRATGLAFLFGWLAGLAASTAVFIQLPRLLGGFDQEPRAWTAWARIGIGLLLVVFGAFRWLTRHRATRSPAWLDGLSRIAPITAGVIGIGLPLMNPKVLFANGAAGLVIGSTGAGSSWLWLAFYVAIACSTVAVPILAFVAAPGRLEGVLERLRQWIDRRHAVLTAVILAVIGGVLLYQGIRAA
jgi:Sap, sulfolipid-1-addressing protein